MTRPLLSSRTLDTLTDLHRAVSAAVTALNQHQTLLLGAARGCDLATQYLVLDEHRALASAALVAVRRLEARLNLCLGGSATPPAPTSAPDDLVAAG